MLQLTFIFKLNFYVGLLRWLSCSKTLWLASIAGHGLASQAVLILYKVNRLAVIDWGYRGGSPTAVQTWQPCPLWEPSPSHPILL